jgi:hypothetical protein
MNRKSARNRTVSARLSICGLPAFGEMMALVTTALQTLIALFLGQQCIVRGMIVAHIK